LNRPHDPSLIVNLDPRPRPKLGPKDHRLTIQSEDFRFRQREQIVLPAQRKTSSGKHLLDTMCQLLASFIMYCVTSRIWSGDGICRFAISFSNPHLWLCEAFS